MSIKKELFSSELPVEIQKLIRRVARRTRLRSREQLDVARELKAHFEDALAAGDSPNEAIAAYGNEKTAAKLLRNACKRKRWWLEVAFVKSMKYTAVAFGCIVVVYVVMVFFAMQRKPNIAVDYVAQLNETAASIPENERAWPYYREALIALNKNDEPTPEVNDRPVQPEWAGDAGWDEYAHWIDSHKETVNLILQGSAKQGVGFIVGGSMYEKDKELWPEEYEASQLNQDNSMLSVLFPQLGHFIELARLLHYDALKTASEGESQQCYEDVEAMLRVGSQIREHSTLINDLVTLAVYNLAFQTIGTILEKNPAVLSSHLGRLETQLSLLNEEMNIRFDGERMFILDLLQRTFTDDGAGDGVPVPGELLKKMSWVGDAAGQEMPKQIPPILFAPIGDLLIASRKELLDRYDSYLLRMEQAREIPLHAWGEDESNYLHPYELSKEGGFLNKYFLIDLLIPSLDAAVLHCKYTRANRDGLLATIYALSEYQSTGLWPEDLSNTSAIDPWSGEPWNITIVNERPVIYSIGNDQDDDGGRHAEEANKWHSPTAVPDGDWVVWPSPE